MSDTKQYHVSNDAIMEGIDENIIIKKDGDLYKAYDLEAISNSGRVVPIFGCSSTNLTETVYRARRLFGTHINNNDHNPNLNY